MNGLERKRNANFGGKHTNFILILLLVCQTFCRFTIQFSKISGNIVFAFLVYVIAVFGTLTMHMSSVNLNLLIQSIKYFFNSIIISNHFIFDQLFKANDIFGLLQIMVTIFITITTWYVFCHFGDRVTHFEAISTEVYQLNWYMLPLDVQKHLPMVIALAQKRVYVRGFADTRSTQEVFMKVKWSFSKVTTTTEFLAKQNRFTTFSLLLIFIFRY